MKQQGLCGQWSDQLCGLLLFAAEDLSFGMLKLELKEFIVTCGEVDCDVLVAQKSHYCHRVMAVSFADLKYKFGDRRFTRVSNHMIEMRYQPNKNCFSFFAVSCLSSPAERCSWDLSMSEG